MMPIVKGAVIVKNSVPLQRWN